MSKSSISFLLGAGFSAPMGYPIGNQLNERLINFRQYKIGVSTDGKLFSLIDGQDTQTYGNPYSIYLDCCISLIEKYSTLNKFDYEEFFEFLAKKLYLSNPEYLEVCKTHITETITIDCLSSNIQEIYNQMVAHLLKDGDNMSWYDNKPYHIGRIDKYDGFLNLLKKWKEDNIIHVHTLNHDMLFESFNKTDYISGEVCDGFEELGSDYYGILRTKEDHTYTVRLERYTATYNRNIRLYKLHGSLDYVLYYRTSDKTGTMVPDKYIKTKYGIGYDKLLRDTHNGVDYERYPFAYNASFLTGTTSKIKKYEDPYLFKQLFELFKNNLEHSEILIIIGYGCKDIGINKIIAESFKGRDIYIVDPYCDGNVTVMAFAKKVGAQIIKTQISDLKIEEFNV